MIRKEIFPRLTKKQAYELLNRIVVLTFIIGVLGVVAYLAINLRNERLPPIFTPAATPVQSPEKAELSGTVFDQSERPLPGARVTLDEIPGMKPVETSSNGVFNLHDIPWKYGDAVRVRVVKEGYEPYTEDVVLGKAPPIIKLRKKR